MPKLEVTPQTIDAQARARQYRRRAAGVTFGAAALHQVTNKLQIREHVPAMPPPADLFMHSNSLFWAAGVAGLTLGLAGLNRRSWLVRNGYQLAIAGAAVGALTTALSETSLVEPLAKEYPEYIVSAVSDPIDDLYGTTGALVTSAYITASVRRRTPDVLQSMPVGTYHDGQLHIPHQRTESPLTSQAVTSQTEQ